MLRQHVFRLVDVAGEVVGALVHRHVLAGDLGGNVRQDVRVSQLGHDVDVLLAHVVAVVGVELEAI